MRLQGLRPGHMSPLTLGRYSFICQRSNYFRLQVKLPPVTTSLTTQR